MANELKGLAAGLIAGLGVVGAAYGVSAIATHGQSPGNVSEKPSASAAPATTAASSQLVASGVSLYKVSCIGCHGAQAQGNIGPTLHHLGDPDTKIARNIKNGFPPQMPAYKDKYTDAQINSLVAYIQTFE
ncbi:MAG: c-type cytochrome [Janthinobacterium lividum]